MAIAAAEVGSRFAREAVAHDPAAWMVAPRRLFEGRPAIEACQELRGFLRATVLNGLLLSLDAAPGDVDALLDEPEDDEVGPPVEVVDVSWPGPRLLSAWIDPVDGEAPAVAFCAMVVEDPSVFARRLAQRFGPRAAAVAEVELGFDPTTTRASALIADGLADDLVRAAADPGSPFARGLDVCVEQRFGA